AGELALQGGLPRSPDSQGAAAAGTPQSRTGPGVPCRRLMSGPGLAGSAAAAGRGDPPPAGKVPGGLRPLLSRRQDQRGGGPATAMSAPDHAVAAGAAAGA